MGSGGPDDEGDACPGRPFETVLATPDRGVLATLSVGDLLDIERIDHPIRGVMARTLAGDNVGAVTRDIRFLRNCIDRGHLYEAEVLRISGGAVTVQIRGRGTS